MIRYSVKNIYLLIECHFDEELEFGPQGVAQVHAFSTEEKAMEKAKELDDQYETDHWNGGIWRLKPNGTVEDEYKNIRHMTHWFYTDRPRKGFEEE